MGIQSNINTALTVAGALASQSPQFKQQSEVRMATSNFDRLQKAIDELTAQHAQAKGNEKRAITNMKKQFVKQSNVELEKMKDIALKSGDVEGLKKYNEMKLINNPPKIRTKTAKARQSLTDAQIQQKAQQTAVKSLIDDIREVNRRQDIKAKSDVIKKGGDI